MWCEEKHSIQNHTPNRNRRATCPSRQPSGSMSVYINLQPFPTYSFILYIHIPKSKSTPENSDGVEKDLEYLLCHLLPLFQKDGRQHDVAVFCFLEDLEEEGNVRPKYCTKNLPAKASCPALIALRVLQSL